MIAEGTAVVVHKLKPKAKLPALIGFAISPSEAVLGEVAEAATGGKFSALDVAAGTLGAAAGAYATDKWYLAPRVESQKSESTYALMATRKF